MFRTIRNTIQSKNVFFRGLSSKKNSDLKLNSVLCAILVGGCLGSYIRYEYDEMKKERMNKEMIKKGMIADCITEYMLRNHGKQNENENENEN